MGGSSKLDSSHAADKASSSGGGSRVSGAGRFFGGGRGKAETEFVWPLTDYKSLSGEAGAMSGERLCWPLVGRAAGGGEGDGEGEGEGEGGRDGISTAGLSIDSLYEISRGGEGGGGGFHLEVKTVEAWRGRREDMEILPV